DLRQQHIHQPPAERRTPRGDLRIGRPCGDAEQMAKQLPPARRHAIDADLPPRLIPPRRRRVLPERQVDLFVTLGAPAGHVHSRQLSPHVINSVSLVARGDRPVAASSTASSTVDFPWALAPTKTLTPCANCSSVRRWFRRFTRRSCVRYILRADDLQRVCAKLHSIARHERPPTPALDPAIHLHAPGLDEHLRLPAGLGRLRPLQERGQLYTFCIDGNALDRQPSTWSP